jgi:hypothetical protein
MDLQKYNKEYYSKNKDKMKEQSQEANKRRKLKIFIEKLNNKGFKRVPYSKIEKYNIKYDNNKYYIELP